MGIEYSSQGSSEYSSHKFSRVQDMKTARKNLARKLDEREISYYQEAMRRRDMMSAEKSSVMIQPAERQKMDDDQDISAAFLDSLVEVQDILRPDEKIYSERIANQLNSRIGDLIKPETSLRAFVIKEKNRVRHGVKAPITRALYGALRNNIETVGDLQGIPVRELGTKRWMTDESVIFLKTVFKPTFKP